MRATTRKSDLRLGTLRYIHLIEYYRSGGRVVIIVTGDARFCPCFTGMYDKRLIGTYRRLQMIYGEYLHIHRNTVNVMVETRSKRVRQHVNQ